MRYLIWLTREICFFDKTNKEKKLNEKESDLIIIDDYFPNLLTAFRVAEFNYYLKNIKKSIVYSTAYQCDIHLKKYETEFKQFEGRVFKFDKNDPLNAKLIYLIFINNVFGALSFIEKSQTPFIFTLYPGGGFKLDVNEDKYDFVFCTYVLEHVFKPELIFKYFDNKLILFFICTSMLSLFQDLFLPFLAKLYNFLGFS